MVDKLHLAKSDDRLAEVKALYKPATATLDYNTSSESEHLGRLYLDHAGIEPLSDLPRLSKVRKNVMLEKPIALELWKPTNSSSLPSGTI
jgi:hypothetical protein